MKILVTGDREWTDRDTVHEQLVLAAALDEIGAFEMVFFGLTIPSCPPG